MGKKYAYQRGLTVDNNLPLQEMKKEFAKIGVYVTEDSLLNLMVHLMKKQMKETTHRILNDDSCGSSIFSLPHKTEPIMTRPLFDNILKGAVAGIAAGTIGKLICSGNSGAGTRL